MTLSEKEICVDKRLLREAFFELAQDEDLESISIQKLCMQADVKRGEFYDVYGNLDSLIEDCEDFLLAEMRQCYDVPETIGDSLRNVIAVIAHIRERKFYYKVLFKPGILENFKYKLEEIYTDNVLKRIDFNDKNPQTYYTKIFIMYGTLQVIVKWLENDCDIPDEEFADLILEMQRRGLRYVED